MRNKVNGSIQITPFFSLPSHEIGRRKSGFEEARATGVASIAWHVALIIEHRGEKVKKLDV